MAKEFDYFATLSDESPEEKEFDENLLQDDDDVFDNLMSPENNPLIDTEDKAQIIINEKVGFKNKKFKPVKVFKHNANPGEYSNHKRFGSKGSFKVSNQKLCNDVQIDNCMIELNTITPIKPNNEEELDPEQFQKAAEKLGNSYSPKLRSLRKPKLSIPDSQIPIRDQIYSEYFCSNGESKFNMKALSTNNQSKITYTELLTRIKALEQENEVLLDQVKQQDEIIKKQADKINELLNSKFYCIKTKENIDNYDNHDNHHKPTILFDTSSIVSIECDELEEEDIQDLQNLHYMADFEDKEEQKHLQFTVDGERSSDFKNEKHLTTNIKNNKSTHKVGATIASCFNKQKINLVTAGSYRKPNNNLNLRSPRLLQNKLAGKPNIPANNNLNKFLDFKSTTEGSCVDENSKPKASSTIMDNYLQGNNSVKSNSFYAGNQGFVPFSNNKNNTVCGAQPKIAGSKRKNNKISVLNLSLIGSMMIKTQQSQNQSKDQ